MLLTGIWSNHLTHEVKKEVWLSFCDDGDGDSIVVVAQQPRLEWLPPLTPEVLFCSRVLLIQAVNGMSTQALMWSLAWTNAKWRCEEIIWILIWMGWRTSGTGMLTSQDQNNIWLLLLFVCGFFVCLTEVILPYQAKI